MTTTSPLIHCRRLGKTYRTLRRREGVLRLLGGLVKREHVEHAALVDADLDILQGEMVGLIGANGAGKTTLVKILAGIIPKTHGTAEVFGRDCFDLRDAEKTRLSLVMGQRSQLWWDIPPLDSFRLLRAIYDVDHDVFERRVAEHAERLGVADRLEVQLRQLSLGQRMKMEIIGAFLHDPELVFLDEPTIGLDLVSQETIRRFLRDLNRERGVTILLTSHDMADIEQTCERLLILDGGKLLFDGDLPDLQRRLVGKRRVELHLEDELVGEPTDAAEVARKHDGELVEVSPRRLVFLVPTARSQALVRELFDLLAVKDLSVERQPLEDLVREVFRRGQLEDAP
ncbi:MAG: ATP-binding cassette domain-containing protein [Acidobacteriota bacterium]